MYTKSVYICYVADVAILYASLHIIDIPRGVTHMHHNFDRREAYRSNTLTLEGIKRVIKVDPEKHNQIYDFFIRDTNLGLSSIEHEFRTGTGPGGMNTKVAIDDSHLQSEKRAREEGDSEGAGGGVGTQATAVPVIPQKAGPGRKKKIKV